MLTIDDARSLLADIDYRPGGGDPVSYQLDVDPDDRTIKVTMTVNVHDSRGAGSMLIPIVRTLSTADMADAETFVRAMLQHSVWFAAHEACEWFRFEGVMVADPHVMASPEIRVRRVNLPEKAGRW